jgi:PKD repeat protein
MISSSSAVVQIYNANGLLRSIQVPTSGDDDYWNVCTIDGATGSVTVINQIQSGSPGSKSSFKSGSIAEKHFFPDGKELYKTASIQDIVSYSWDFGDGQSSSDPDPTHIYQNAGSYTVSLTVSDGSNQATETKTNYISASGGLSELVLLNESFEGDVSNWSYIDNNNDDVYWQIYYEESPPDTVAHTGIHGAGIWYNASGNDDYLITPQIEIPAGAQDVTLSFWSHSHSASYLENFSVKISTGGKDINDFSTTIIGSQTAPYDWTEYEYDNLAAYAGQSIYIAFHNTSVDKWYQWLDDVRVVAQVQTAIDEPNVTAGAEEFALYSNYPNPFNPTTTISYQLASASFVKISIYDARGKLVETLVNEQKDRGNYSVVWDASGLSSGIYIYKITAGKYSNVNKCLLIR